MSTEKDKELAHTVLMSGSSRYVDPTLEDEIAKAFATVRGEVWNETFRIQCVDCAEGDEPIYSKEARWFYHGISNQEVGCSASKLRIAALEAAATENRKGEG